MTSPPAPRRGAGWLAPALPDLDWDHPKSPRDRAAGDGYFASHNGFAEACAVYVDGCRLTAQWQALRDASAPAHAVLGSAARDTFDSSTDGARRAAAQAAPQEALSAGSAGETGTASETAANDALGVYPSFVLAELGLGSGLNLLAAARAWRAVFSAPDASPPDANLAAPPHPGPSPSGPSPSRPRARLHLVSIDHAPLSAPDAARLRGLGLASVDDPITRALDADLTRAWPARVAGVIHTSVAPDIALTVAHLPVDEALAALDFTADAWFLDGYAPRCNEEMWSPEVLSQVAARTRPGARLASFTVATRVRARLERAGFAVSKRPGFADKRERLEAQRVKAAPTTSPPPAASAPWRAPALPPSASVSVSAGAGVSVLVIGAGLAGAACAHAFVRRGAQVTVLDARDGPARGASGNAVGLVMPRLDLDDQPMARAHRAAFVHALNTYQHLEPGGFTQLGVRQHPRTQADAVRYAALVEAGALPPDHLTSDGEALWFATAGAADPARVVAAFLKGAHVRTHARVATLERTGDGWRALDAGGAPLGAGNVCVIATGPDLERLAPGVEVRPSRGQISFAPWRDTSRHGEPGQRPDADQALSPALDQPAHAFGGYALPGARGVWFGATYDPWPDTTTDPQVDADSHARNVDLLTAHLPQLAAALDLTQLEGRASVRATTLDHAPYAGAAPDPDALARWWRGRERGEPASDPAPETLVRPGLYVVGGLGSRGLVFAPILGEAVAAEALGEPAPLEAGARAAVHPARALLRRWRRGQKRS